MNAQDTLIAILAREAGKLDVLSKAAIEPLAGAQLEALEVLCRCTKQLRAPTREPEDEEPADVAADLAAVSGINTVVRGA